MKRPMLSLIVGDSCLTDGCPCDGDARWHGPHTYVVMRDRWVKIGRSRNIDTRLRSFRTSARPTTLTPSEMDWKSPLRLVTTFPFDAEADLHAICAEWREVGEWFRATDDLMWEVMRRAYGWHWPAFRSNPGDPEFAEWFMATAAQRQGVTA